MGGRMLNGGNRRTTYFVLSILLVSTLPMLSTVSADVGIPDDLQAQDITVSFDNVSETTTVSWRNIEDTAGNFNLYSELWDATYHIYRHTAQITPTNIESLTPWTSVTACDQATISQSIDCRGEALGTHEVTYQVGAGTNGTFYYAITTELGNGTITSPLDFGASSLLEPVTEITTPIRSPFNVQATFDPGASQTTVQWINYNSLYPILPETGPDALQINVWQTNFQITRANADSLFIQDNPDVTKVATVSSTSTNYVLDIPPQTNREVYYSVTYLLPNWTDNGSDYEDIRFLSSNAMTSPLLEDNTPPNDVTTVEALFNPLENGTGYTTIAWDGLFSEENEVYKIYRHGEYFASTNDPYAQLIATVAEAADTDGDGSFVFYYNVPYNTFGNFIYCVVVVDQYGAYNTDISSNSCDDVDEDSDENWVKEPTNVKAEFIGNQTTRVTWTDQVGIEGERYHVWRAAWRVQSAEFQENMSMIWMGSVADGVEQFDVQLDPGVISSNTHYFVTSEALYNCQGCNGTMMYKELVQNWDGPIVEDTQPPNPARISNLMMLGELKIVDLEWFNTDQENGETYSLYRHFGDPFGDSEFAVSNYTDAGWELIEESIPENEFATMIRQIPVPVDTQRDVWYAVIVTDSFGNINPQILPGIGGNALMVTEDTQAPTITYSITDEDSVPILDNSIVRGEYTLRIETSEMLNEFPIINITTSAGESLTGGSETAMVLLSQNTNNPNKGPEYFQSFTISSSTTAGDLLISINLTDMVLNNVEREITEFSIDAKSPTVTIFSPTPENDGAMYLYGNSIKVIGGATDDVGIVDMQMRFVQNYGTSSSVTEPWRNVTGLTINEDGDWTFEMSFSSGNFLPGVHEVSVKAVDSAGNERTSKVKFVTDFCRQRVSDGATVCEYSSPVAEEPETIYAELNATDPPYMIAWVTAGVSLLAVLVSLVVITTAMSSPRKKRGDDDDDAGDDWMKEFIGTSSEPDMAVITGTAPKEEKREEQKSAPENDEDDPFAVNIVQPKRRRKKKASDYDDDGEDEEVDWEEGESPRKRPRKRRAPPRRKPAKRKRS